MGLKEAVNGFVSGLRGSVPVVDTKHTNPTQRNVPAIWSSAFGPGQPVSSGLDTMSARQKDAQTEPRTFSYPPNVNATLSPRMAYGLMPFSDLRFYAESIPEVGTCIRIITEEIKSFTPHIVHADGSEYHSSETDWMIQTPDRFNSWPVWLSRFLYNTLVYDAAAVHRPYDSRGHVASMRVIDGSTLFAMVDESGEQPHPPAPAFCQVIFGIPRMYLNTHNIWYHPRHMRADAPYGRSPIEDALPAIKLLANLWDYEQKWYTEGTTAEQILTAPADWTPDQVLSFESSYNNRMAGNTEERAGRVRFVPAGTTAVATKDAAFRQDIYDAATNTVRMAFGIPRTEFGEAPGSGLGGTGFLEAMQNLFYRLSVAPLKAYIEALFDETLRINGYSDLRMELEFPKESLDPKKEEDRIIARFQNGIIDVDEARRGVGLEPKGGAAGRYMVTNAGMPQGPDGMTASRFGQAAIPVSNRIPVSNGIPVANRIPVSAATIQVNKVGKLKKTWVTAQDDGYYGAPVAVEDGKAVIGTDRLASRGIQWQPGADGREEAVYLLDRAFAYNDQRYLVPLAYKSTVDDKDGMVLVQPAGRKPAAGVGRYGREWVEQAAVLDYVAGNARGQDGYRGHPDDADRVILPATGHAFEDGQSSPFVQAWYGNELSSQAMLALEYLAGDESLWRDVEECAGTENAATARARVVALLQSGKML